MPLDLNRVDLLLQYSLLVAGEQDESFDRQLGPIHLLKYVYLADLAFARRNAGATFTGVPWRFHNFGPWAVEVYERIEPSLRSIGAQEVRFESDYGKDDWVRWSIRDEWRLNDAEKLLPPTITLQLRPLIKKFGKDTPHLLDYVYRTSPMLSTAPGENIDFGLSVEEAIKADKSALRMDRLTDKRKKKFIERMRELQRIASEPKPVNRINPVKNARYDDVYLAGVEWLDRLAGEQLLNGEYTAEFLNEIWKSPSRKDKNVS